MKTVSLNRAGKIWSICFFLQVKFRSFLEILETFEKNRTTPTPKKTQKTPKKRLMDFHDGITCQRFELEGWDLV